MCKLHWPLLKAAGLYRISAMSTLPNQPNQEADSKSQPQSDSARPQETSSTQSVPPPGSLPATTGTRRARWPRWLLGSLVSIALLLAVLFGVRQYFMVEQLTRQTAEALTTATEARVLAQQGQVREQDLIARQAVLDARLNDTALQRSQLESLMQSLSRSRDEFLIADIESTLRLAQEHTQLSGSSVPMLAALRSLQRRLHAASAQFAPVQRAVTQDLARIESTSFLDTPALLARLNGLLRLADEVPLANAMARAGTAPPSPAKARTSDTAAVNTAPAADWTQRLNAWWQRQWAYASETLRGLVRVSRIDGPEAALLAPDEAFFLRENLQLLLLNARQALLARQPEAARLDLLRAESLLKKYFDPNAATTRQMLELLHGAQLQVQNLTLPRADATLAALAAWVAR